MSYLELIQKPNDIQNIPSDAYDQLASEIRAFLLEKVSRTGGHLASSLGTVELTMALHLFLHFPEDKLVWDVGHQAYTHKLLTGRRDGFDTLRQFGGMSGFPKRRESECDAFDTGHSSTSISAAMGLAKARDLAGGKGSVVAVIGDGAMTGGLAYEALDNLSKLGSSLIIVLNDNNMSISENVGGFSNYLNDVRTSSRYLDLRDKIYYSMNDRSPKVVSGIRRAKNSLKQLVVPGMFFEDLGITYLGPVDGHNIRGLLRVLEDAKRVKKPVLIHAITQKGRGYLPAETHPDSFHGIVPFDVSSGRPLKEKTGPDWTDIFSDTMVDIAAHNSKVVGVTAAMEDGVGLRAFHSRYPQRFFDVGIAEQHAVTFAAGMAAGGMTPVVAVYSSFLQRAYDQILHDVALQDLPVVLAVDRAGLVGADGETHQGSFDLSFLSSIPNMTILAPKNAWELGAMLRFAVEYGHPVAIRYPRGRALDILPERDAPIALGKSEYLRPGDRAAILSVGSMMEECAPAAEALDAALVNVRFVKPIDEEMILRLAEDHELLVTVEDNTISGGFGQQVAAFAEKKGLPVRVLSIGIPDRFVEQGTVPQLRKALGMDTESIVRRVREALA